MIVTHRDLHTLQLAIVSATPDAVGKIVIIGRLLLLLLAHHVHLGFDLVYLLLLMAQSGVGLSTNLVDIALSVIFVPYFILALIRDRRDVLCLCTYL